MFRTVAIGQKHNHNSIRWWCTHRNVAGRSRVLTCDRSKHPTVLTLQPGESESLTGTAVMTVLCSTQVADRLFFRPAAAWFYFEFGLEIRPYTMCLSMLTCNGLEKSLSHAHMQNGLESSMGSNVCIITNFIG